MKVKLENVILSMPYLFEAKAFDADSDAKFSAHFLVEKNSPAMKVVVDAIQAEAKALWKDAAPGKLKAVKAAGKIWCLRDGDGKVDKNGEPFKGYAGRYFVSAKNTLRPTVVDGQRQPVDAADGKVYAGCVVNAFIDVRANAKPSDQVYAYLLGVQFVKDGERLGGGAVASADDFEAIPGTEAAKGAETSVDDITF